MAGVGIRWIERGGEMGDNTSTMQEAVILTPTGAAQTIKEYLEKFAVRVHSVTPIQTAEGTDVLVIWEEQQ